MCDLLGRGNIHRGAAGRIQCRAGLSASHHPGVELRANLKSISHRCHLFEVAFVWELTRETIHLPRGCLQDGMPSPLAPCCRPSHQLRGISQPPFLLV